MSLQKISEPECSYLNDQSKVNLTDLNVDCLNRLDLVGLTNMAKISRDVAVLAGDIFRQKYADYNVVIKGNATQGSNSSEQYSLIPYTSKSIELYDLEVFQNILQFFGSNLRKITIANDADVDLTTANRLVNEYCSESLTELNLNIISENELRQYTKPFKAVEKLSFLVTSDVIGNTTLNEFESIGYYIVTRFEHKLC